MRIALLTPTFSKFSGIDRLVEMDAEEYAKKRGDKVTIFTFKGDIKTKYAKVEYLGMPKNQTLERLYRLFFFLNIVKIKKYAKKLKDYDRVISYCYPLSWVARYAKKKYNLRYEHISSGVAYPHLFSGFERLYMLLFEYLERKSMDNADEVFAISEFIQEELKKGNKILSPIKSKKRDFYKNNINAKRFHKGIDGNKIRRRYNIKKGDVVLLYVGRISPHKRIHILLKSFNLILKKVPNAKLLIVGKHTFGSYSKKLKKLSNKSVIFTGFVPDKELPYYYAASDIYVTATLWEGLDFPVVEAQACGKQVVAFNVGSHRYMNINEKKGNGILVKPEDVRGFADGVIGLLKRKKQTIII